MRDYKKESEKLKETTARFECRIPKEDGARFKSYLKSKNTNFNSWCKELINRELDDYKEKKNEQTQKCAENVMNKMSKLGL